MANVGNVFYPTFTNVFFIFSTFFNVFLTFFSFLSQRLLHLCKPLPRLKHSAEVIICAYVRLHCLLFTLRNVNFGRCCRCIFAELRIWSGSDPETTQETLSCVVQKFRRQRLLDRTAQSRSQSGGQLLLGRRQSVLISQLVLRPSIPRAQRSVQVYTNSGGRPISRRRLYLAL